VAERVELQRPIAAHKDIALRMKVSPTLPAVVGDRMRLSQVIDNLLTNAVKYSHSGTTTVVQARVRHRQLWVSGRDRGQGIAPADLGKLFQPFGVTSTRATSGEKSTGLGLLIVKRIAEAHGGSVRVRSRLGVGTTFHLVLPLSAS
jgi:signal transduction histidine kinase